MNLIWTVSIVRAICVHFECPFELSNSMPDFPFMCVVFVVCTVDRFRLIPTD